MVTLGGKFSRSTAARRAQRSQKATMAKAAAGKSSTVLLAGRITPSLAWPEAQALRPFVEAGLRSGLRIHCIHWPARRMIA